MNVFFVAHKHGIAPNLLFCRRKLMNKGGKVPIETHDRWSGFRKCGP
jgi:hypothetical protein